MLSKFEEFTKLCFPLQYFVQNNIAYDPEYVFYDIKVSNFILIFNLFDNVKFKHRRLSMVRNFQLYDLMYECIKCVKSLISDSSSGIA